MARWSPQALSALPNVNIAHGRLTRALLEAELAPLQARGGGTVRVLVSGPEAFNGAVKEMLLASGMDEEMVTILEA